MKAYKQINLKPEKMLVTGYITVLSIICLFILISPVIAKTNPSIQHEFKRTDATSFIDLDDDANLTFTLSEHSSVYDQSEKSVFKMHKTDFPFSDSILKNNEFKWFMTGYINGLFMYDPTNRLYFKMASDSNKISNKVDDLLQFNSLTTDSRQDSLSCINFIYRYGRYQAEHYKLLLKYFNGI